VSEVFHLPPRRDTRGHEQRGCALRGHRPGRRVPRPQHDAGGTHLDGRTVVDPQRLGRSAGRLEAGELRAVEAALMLILGL